MAVSLSIDDLIRLEEANRVLVSPLVAPTPEAWAVEAVRATRELVGADHALLAHAGLERVHIGEDPDDPVAASYMDVVEATAGQFQNPLDVVSDLWLRDHRARGLGVYSSPRIETFLQDRGHSLLESPTMTNVMWANGRYEIFGMVVASGGTEAAIQFANGRTGFQVDGEAARPLLQAVLPSFRAGLDALGRLAAQRAALGALDTLAEPLAALDADGRERYRNPALARLLEADPDRLLVEGALWRLGGDLRRLAFRRRLEGPAGPAPMQQLIVTRRGRYALSAALVPAGAFGPDETALVTVAAEVAPDPMTPTEVRERTGLTAREAEVALLMAEGLSNAQIADRLFVAVGTVKRHVEGVLGKLGVESRAAVANRLRQPAAGR